MEKIEIFFGMNESVVSQPCDLLRVCRLQLCHVCPVGSRVCSPDSHVSRLPGRLAPCSRNQSQWGLLRPQ